MTARLVQPWRGDRYEGGFSKGLKLLIVGDSHYDSEPASDLTRYVVQRYGIDQPIAFFDTVRTICSGTPDAVAPQDFWHKVAFCNFVQDCMVASHDEPTERQFEAGWQALLQTIEELAPDVMFVFSRRAWERTGPELVAVDAERSSGNLRDDMTGLYRYERHGRRPLISAAFNHPSRLLAPRGVWRAWADFVWREAARLSRV